MAGEKISPETLKLIVEEITKAVLERLSTEELEFGLGYKCTGSGYTCGRSYKCIGEEHECTGAFTCLLIHEWMDTVP